MLWRKQHIDPKDPDQFGNLKFGPNAAAGFEVEASGGQRITEKEDAALVLKAHNPVVHIDRSTRHCPH